MGKLAAVKLAIACGPSSASRSAAASHACHRAARVISAAASTTASGTLQGRMVAALMRRATDSPRTISTKIRNRSARALGALAAKPTQSSTHSHQMGVKTITKRASAPSVGSCCKAPASCPTAPTNTRSKKSSSQLVGCGSRWWPSAVRSGGGLKWMGWRMAGCAGPGRGSHGDPRHIMVRTDQGGHGVPFSLSRVASESPSPRWPYQCTRWASRSCCGRGADGRDVGTADRRESSGFLSGRLSTIQRGMPEMAPMNTTAAGILSQNQRGMSVSVLEVLPAPCVLVTDAGVCLTDSTLGAERHRQIGCSYGDLHLRNLDLNRGIGRTTEPGPKPGVRLGRKRLSSRRPSRRRSGTARRRPRRPRVAERPAAHSTGPVRRRRT